MRWLNSSDYTSNYLLIATNSKIFGKEILMLEPFFVSSEAIISKIKK